MVLLLRNNYVQGYESNVIILKNVYLERAQLSCHFKKLNESYNTSETSMNNFMINRLFMFLAVLTFACVESTPDLPSTRNVRIEPQKPLMKNFIGLNAHFTFKPELYCQVTNLVRNYHPMSWDVNLPGDSITFPVCVNEVNWNNNVYGKWSKYGFEIDICVELNTFGPNNSNYIELWKERDQWSYDYGFKLANYFGPSGEHKLSTSIEIGNEPGGRFNDNL